VVPAGRRQRPGDAAGHHAGAGPGAGRHRPAPPRVRAGLRRPGRHRGLADRHRDARPGRPQPDGEGGRAVGPVRRGAAGAGHREAPPALPGADDDPPAARLLRDDRERPRLGRAVAAHHGDVRRGTRPVRRDHPGRRGTQGLHRQCRAGREGRRGVRPARDRWREPRGARAGRADPRRVWSPVPWRADRGLRAQGRPQRRGQRPALVRPGAGAQRGTAGQVRRGRSRRQLQQPDREQVAALLHDARRPGPGPGQRRRRGGGRCAGGARDRGRARREPAAVRPARERRRDPRPRLPVPPAAAAARPRHVVRAALHPGPARLRPARSADRRQHRRRPAARARVPRRGTEGDQHLACHGDHPGLPGGLWWRRLPVSEPVGGPEGRQRRVHHLRGRQHGSHAAGGAGHPHQLPRPLRRPGHAGHRPLPGRAGEGGGAGAHLGPRTGRPAGRRGTRT
jgi:hypothetical protein